MNERVITELVIDARQSKAAAGEYEAAMAKASRAVEKLKAESRDLRIDSNLPRSVDRVSQAYDKLRGSIDPVAKAQIKAEQDMRRALALVDRAVMTGVATQQQAAATISGLRQKQVQDIERVRQAQLRLNGTRHDAGGLGGGGSEGGGSILPVGGLTSLRGALGPLAGFLSVRQIGEWADAWTAAGNSLRAVSEITGVQTRSLEALNDIARDTRSSFEGTVDLYNRLTFAASGVAKSEQELADATRIINESFKVGGKSAQEQAAGIQQLSQALASGVLQGDELRSIRENAPLLAKAIADEFNTSIGGLKALGATGELTADRVFRAILKGEREIHAAFQQTTATLSDGFTQLGNSVIGLIGRIDNATGFTKAITDELNRLSDAIDKAGTNPNLENILNIGDIKIRPGSLADTAAKYLGQLYDEAAQGQARFQKMVDDSAKASQRSTKDILEDIDNLQFAINRLADGKVYRFSIIGDTNPAMEKLRELRNELLSVLGSAATSGALGGIGGALARGAFDAAQNGGGAGDGSAVNVIRYGNEKLTDAVNENTSATRDSGMTICDWIRLLNDTASSGFGSVRETVYTGSQGIQDAVRNGFYLNYTSLESAIRTGIVNGLDDSLLGKKYTSVRGSSLIDAQFLTDKNGDTKPSGLEQMRQLFTKGTVHAGMMAEGGSFVIPGNSPTGDKIPVTMFGNSGEKVTVEPVGQSGGGNTYIYQAAPGETAQTAAQAGRAFLEFIQRATARA